jgi:lysozyme
MNLQNSISIAKDFIRKVEGFKSKPYNLGDGHWTNGYGNTKYTPQIEVSLDKAEKDLDCNINDAVQELLGECSLANLAHYEDHEVAALISFVFNAGAGNWTIWTDINKFNFTDIPVQLLRFDHAKINGKLVEVKGLANRRNAEIVLWDTADTNTAFLAGGCGPQGEVKPFAPNNLDVAPKPDPAKQIKSSNGVKSVATVTAASVPFVAVHATGFHAALPYIVGFLIGCAFCLALGAILYYFELKKPKLDLPHWVEPAKPQLPDWIVKLMATSQAFQDALAALLAAKDAEAQALVAAAETAADTDATQALVDAKNALPQPVVAG